jgi:uncharacterized protein YodC (DUF2158 family)
MVKRFRIGDVVTLKGGSPAMTIIDDKLDQNKGNFSFNGNYRCSYFESYYEVRRIFPQESIKNLTNLR